MVISDITVINPGVGRQEHQTIVVHDGKIVAVRPTDKTDPPPVCAGCFAIPGLIDMHIHTPPIVALGNQRLFSLLYLSHGVTSVRDMGQNDNSVAGLAADLNEGRIAGPHMYRCGPILNGDPVGWPAAMKVTTPNEGTEAVRKIAATRVDCIKVYSEVNRLTYEAIATEAKKQRLPIVGHVPHAVTLRGLWDFEAQHLTGMPYLTRPRPPLGWDYLPSDMLAMMDAEIDQALDVVQSHRISLTPTLANASLRLVASDPSLFKPTPGSRDLPEFWATSWETSVSHPKTQQAIAIEVKHLDRLREIVARAHKRGIDVLAGTDASSPWVVPGESMLLEIDHLARAFGDNEAALAAATTLNGRRIAPGQIGTIAPGYRADILLLTDDPIQSLSALKDWKLLIADGRPFPRKLVNSWVELYIRHFHGTIYASVTGNLAQAVTSFFQHH